MLISLHGCSFLTFLGDTKLPADTPVFWILQSFLPLFLDALGALGEGVMVQMVHVELVLPDSLFSAL